MFLISLSLWGGKSVLYCVTMYLVFMSPLWVILTAMKNNVIGFGSARKKYEVHKEATRCR